MKRCPTFVARVPRHAANPATSLTLRTSHPLRPRFVRRVAGEIPLGIGSLTNLVGLNLGENSFSESIPTTLMKLKNLKHVLL